MLVAARKERREVPNKETGSASSASPIVVAKKINYFYGQAGNKQQVLKSVSLELYPGQITLLAGASGSGKTTLVSLIAALRRMQDGSLKVSGQELLQADHELLLNTRRRIGFIFQQHNLVKFLTAKENVKMSLRLHKGISVKEIDSRADAILEMVGLQDRRDYFPDELSGGQKQRVAVARALVANPELVVADEPTASLDSKSGMEVMKILRMLTATANTSVLLVSHDLRIMNDADRILTLQDGTLEGVTAAPGLMELRS